jgi:hypothetical protein
MRIAEYEIQNPQSIFTEAVIGSAKGVFEKRWFVISQSAIRISSQMLHLLRDLVKSGMPIHLALSRLEQLFLFSGITRVDID